MPRSPPPARRRSHSRDRGGDRKYRSRDDSKDERDARRKPRRSRSRSHERRRPNPTKDAPPPRRTSPTRRSGAYSPPPRRASPPVKRSGGYTPPPRRPSPAKRSGGYTPPPRRASPKRTGGYSPPPRSAVGSGSRDLARSGSRDRGARSGSKVLDVPGPPVDKEKPNFSATGVLAAASNTVNDVVLKYSEPGDARLPPASPAYKLFVFKDAKIVETVELNPRSCWLIGRDRAVADLPVDHPSCSKQHAVLQFRFVTKTDEFGDKKGGVKLYVMDLDSANSTTLNGLEIEGRRFVECREGDLLKFGLSTREYVIMLDRGL